MKAVFIAAASAIKLANINELSGDFDTLSDFVLNGHYGNMDIPVGAREDEPRLVEYFSANC